MTTRQIAKRRGVSFDAVKFHIGNAMAKLGIADRRLLRLWFRAPKGGALDMQTSAPEAAFTVGQIARSVRDIHQAEAWYRDVLQLQHLFTVGTFAFFDCGGVRLYLFQVENESLPESIIYFAVPNIREAYDRLSARGVEFVNAPHLVHRHGNGTEEWMAFFRDLEGRTLALMSKVGPAA
jgi:catechol 2,3-dioxygenase-like lactoylglutathione lyase family enzyme